MVRSIWRAGFRSESGGEFRAAVVEASLQEEERLVGAGVEVRHDPFWRDVSTRLSYELVVAGYEVEAREKAAPEWVPFLAPGRIERWVAAALRRKGIFVSAHDEDVQDLAQDVRERVHAKLHLFDGRRAHFGAWLSAVVRNVVADCLDRYLSPTLALHVPDEGFQDEVDDRVYVEQLRIHVLPTLRDDPAVGHLVRKIERGETFTSPELRLWKRHRPRLKKMCEARGVEV